jgi:MraZ protein
MDKACHGAAVITLDAKGRVAIPTRHRGALLDGGRSLVLTAHPDGCVLIYPAPAWEPVRARVEAFPSFHPQASWWKRLLLGFEEHIAADGAGRILLPPALRQHAKLEREAMMVGQGRYC